MLPDVAKSRQRGSKGFQGITWERYAGDLRAGILRNRGARLPAKGQQASMSLFILVHPAE